MDFDDGFEKPLFKLRDGLLSLAQWGVEKGLTSPERFQLTREARKEEVKRLAAAGVKQTEIAKTVGVGRATVQRDLGAQNGQKSASKRALTEEEEKAKEAKHYREVVTANLYEALTLIDLEPKRAAHTVKNLDYDLAKRMKQELTAQRLRRAAAYLLAVAEQMERKDV